MCAVKHNGADVGNRAVELFDSGYNCAESVLLALSESMGDAKDGSVVPRIATPFGGGVSRNGMICGALSGGILFTGLRLGRKDAGQPRDPSYDQTDSLLRSFADRFGACDCRTLTGIDFKNPEEVQRYKDDIHRNRCVHFVRFVAEHLSGPTVE